MYQIITIYELRIMAVGPFSTRREAEEWRQAHHPEWEAVIGQVTSLDDVEAVTPEHAVGLGGV